MMAFRPRDLTLAEQSRLDGLTQALLGSGEYADQVKAIERSWSAEKLGTARTAAFDARPRGNRCVYCQDNEGRELDHLRPRSLHPGLAWCWSNLIPACSTCGGADHKGARDAILDPSASAGWREVTRRRAPGTTEPVQPPPQGSTAW